MNNQLSATDLMRQAGMTAETYLDKAVRVIDEKFGEGYARANSGLVGDFMKTCANDFDAAIRHQDIQNLTEEVSRSSSSFEHIATYVGELSFFIRYKLGENLYQHASVIASAIQEFRPLYEDYLAFISRRRK